MADTGQRWARISLLVTDLDAHHPLRVLHRELTTVFLLDDQVNAAAASNDVLAELETAAIATGLLTPTPSRIAS